MIRMKISEFYENYFVITLPNGEKVKPVLSDFDRKVLDKSEELNCSPYVRYFKRKIGYVTEVNPIILDSIKN